MLIVYATKHFYLLRGLLTCGHCGLLMGGRINKAGHQNVYYCVNKERSWKTRGEDHPKWKRGINCSMTRSINIDRTNQAVWSFVKQTLQQIRKQTHEQSEIDDPLYQDNISHDGLSTEEITWMTDSLLDQLSEEERKVVIQSMITSISVHLDETSGKHCLQLQMHENYRRWLAAGSEAMIPSETTRETTTDPSESFCEARVITQGDISEDSAAGLATNPNHLEDLFSHGGVTQKGPDPQWSSESPQNSLSVSIGPLNLNVRPLTEYQQSLITRILSLRSRGWSDHQIAKHFNETGYLTPRGRQWIYQSVFSVRRKDQRRSERFGEGEG